MTREGRQQLFSKGDRTFHRIANNCFSIENKKRHSNNCNCLRFHGSREDQNKTVATPSRVSELFGKVNRGSRRWVGVRAGQHRVGVQLLHKGQNQKSAKKSPIFDFRVFSLGLPGAPQGQILGATCQAQGQEPLSCTDSDVSFSLWRYLDFSR